LRRRRRSSAGYPGSSVQAQQAGHQHQASKVLVAHGQAQAPGQATHVLHCPLPCRLLAQLSVGAWRLW
jgi:hypothetical protein